MSTRPVGTRASRTCSPRSTCAARTMTASGWVRIMSTASSADSFAPGLFAGHRVLVVGGTSGIGAGIGRAFATLGGEVQVTGAARGEVDASDLPGAVLDVA